MKQAYLLAGLAFVWWLAVAPHAADVAQQLAWPWGGAVHWLLAGMPAVLALAALHCGLDSVWYRLRGPIIIGL